MAYKYSMDNIAFYPLQYLFSGLFSFSDVINFFTTKGNIFSHFKIGDCRN